MNNSDINIKFKNDQCLRLDNEREKRIAKISELLVIVYLQTIKEK